MPEGGAPKLMRAGVVMVAGHCEGFKEDMHYRKERLVANGNRDKRANLGTVGAAGGANGDAGRHLARCCNHASAAWLSWPTKIQLLQALQRTRAPSYLRASGSAATNAGAGSFVL
jgi:hypothetical protein